LKKTLRYAYVALLAFFILSACGATETGEVSGFENQTYEAQMEAPISDETHALNEEQGEENTGLSNGTADSPNGTAILVEGSFTLGDTFQFDGSSGHIELSLGTDVFWGLVDNSRSDNYGETVFAIPVTIRNMSTQTGGLNQFDFSFFCPDGLRLDSVGSFFDHDIAREGNIRSGASQTGLFYFLYVGDGEYVIEFGFGDSLEVIFEIEYADIPNISEFDISTHPPSTFVPLSMDRAFTLGDTFEFSGSSGELEIAIGTDITWMQDENSRSQHYGAVVFAVPVAITNIGADTGGFNRFDLTMFGSDGLRLEVVGSSFDDDVTREGSMRPGATQEGNFYFLYVGDGQYAMEFGSGFGSANSIEVIFDISNNNENEIFHVASLSESKTQVEFSSISLYISEDIRYTISDTNLFLYFSDNSLPMVTFTLSYTLNDTLDRALTENEVSAFFTGAENQLQYGDEQVSWSDIEQIAVDSFIVYLSETNFDGRRFQHDETLRTTVGTFVVNRNIYLVMFVASPRLHDVYSPYFKAMLSSIEVSVTPEIYVPAQGIEEAQSTPTPAPQIAQTTGSFIGNINSLVFHRSTCGSLPAPQNRIYFETRVAAENSGYRPCRRCNP